MTFYLLSREVFVPSPAPGVGVFAASYHNTLDGRTLLGLHQHISRSDTFDTSFIRFSEDNGRTWSTPVEHATRFEHPDGPGRRFRPGGYLDPHTGRYISIWNEGVLPNDNPLDGMKQYKVHYSISEDGGKTEIVNEQIIHDGPEYNAVHHLPGVTVGKNAAMNGDFAQRPITRNDGVILLPLQITPIGPDGEYYNPGGGYTYHYCQLLMGHWLADGRLKWTSGNRVEGDPNRTTRGVLEPTLAHLDNGRILMVMRGSNASQPEAPGVRWFAISHDGGHSWSTPEAWTYDDGDGFFSPSSCSQLLQHSDGRLLWLGNICEQNSDGNSPRYPFVIGEVDRRSGLLRRETVTAIDDRAPDENPRLTLSNFYAREDLEAGHVLLHMTRLFARPLPPGVKTDWTADALLYRIALQ